MKRVMLVGKVGDQAEGQKKYGGEKNGLVADFPHKCFLFLLVQTRDDNHRCIICEQEIGDVRKDFCEGTIKQESSGDQARDDEQLFRLWKG